MKNWIAVGLLLIATIGSAQAGDVSVGLVTELNRNDPYQGHLFSGGRLWVGQLRQTENSPYPLQVFNAAGDKMVGQLDLPHSVSFLHEVDEQTVAVVGRSSYPWKTHYSLIRTDKPRLDATTVTLPERYQVERLGSVGTSLFFSEPGERAVYQVNRGSITPLPVEISGPGAMTGKDGALWIVERRSFEQGDESLVRYDVDRRTAERFFAKKFRFGLSEILAVKGRDLIAVSESGAEQVLLVDSKTGALVDEIETGGAPFGLSQIGSCLVVANENMTISFISLSRERAELISNWDVSAAGDRLKQPRLVAVSAQSKRAFVRSSYPCPSCSVTQSSVFYAEEAGHETINTCLLSL